MVSKLAVSSAKRLNARLGWPCATGEWAESEVQTGAAMGAIDALSGSAALLGPDGPGGPDGVLGMFTAGSDEPTVVLFSSARLALLDRAATYREVEQDAFTQEGGRPATTIDGQLQPRPVRAGELMNCCLVTCPHPSGTSTDTCDAWR
jgi:hypothetical protein